MEKLNWDNLKYGGCPICGKKLQFRLRGTKNQIRSRKGANLKNDSDYLFCFSCDYQIKETRKMKILEDLAKRQDPKLKALLSDCKYLGD